MAGIPSGEPRDRLLRALFWTLVYHLEPEKWDELARFEPINPAVVDALPHNLDTALDVGAGSGRLTGHLVARCRHVTAIEPSTGLLALLSRRMPQVQPVAGWAEALPVKDHWSQLTTCWQAGSSHMSHTSISLPHFSHFASSVIISAASPGGPRQPCRASRQAFRQTLSPGSFPGRALP